MRMELRQNERQMLDKLALMLKVEERKVIPNPEVIAEIKRTIQQVREQQRRNTIGRNGMRHRRRKHA